MHLEHMGRENSEGLYGGCAGIQGCFVPLLPPKDSQMDITDPLSQQLKHMPQVATSLLHLALPFPLATAIWTQAALFST